jgi:hypothetical protein
VIRHNDDVIEAYPRRAGDRDRRGRDARSLRRVTGWSVAADVSATELARRCLEVLGDPDRRRIAGEKARTFAREKFGVDRMIAETLHPMVRQEEA